MRRRRILRPIQSGNYGFALSLSPAVARQRTYRLPLQISPRRS